MFTTFNFSLNIQNVVAAACDARSVVDQAEKEKLVESISSAVLEILDLQVCFKFLFAIINMPTYFIFNFGRKLERILYANQKANLLKCSVNLHE